MKQKDEKEEYGRAIACRLNIEDYNYFIEIAEIRRLKKSKFLNQIIIEYLNDLKKVEKEYARD